MSTSSQPNFFVLGAPKCGTTSLAAWLSQHRHAYVTPTKEPHHFNTDMSHRLFPERGHYDRLYCGVEPHHLAIGEASVWYLYSKDAVPNIERENPRSKYVVCLRNPTDMFHSLHMQQVFSGNETELDPERAWRIADERRNGRLVPKGAIDVSTLIYPDACALGTQLQRLFDLVERDRIHVLLLDDMARSGSESFRGVLQFLSLPDDDGVRFEKVNEAKAHRSPFANAVIQGVGKIKAGVGMRGSLGLLSRLERFNTKAQKRAALRPHFRAELVEHFRDEVALIEQLLERNLEHWNG